MAASDFVKEILLGYGRILKKDRRSGTAPDSHFLFFRSSRKAGRAALDDKAGEFLAVHLGEHNVDVGESAVRNPHLLTIQNPVLAIGRKHCASASGERIRASLRFGKAVAGKKFACGDPGQIFFLLLFGAEIDDWNCS